LIGCLKGTPYTFISALWEDKMPGVVTCIAGRIVTNRTSCQGESYVFILDPGAFFQQRTSKDPRDAVLSG